MVAVYEFYKMGNTQAASQASDSKASGKNRRNSNVKGRMLARFGHRKSAQQNKKGTPNTDEEFTNLELQLGGGGGGGGDGDGDGADETAGCSADATTNERLIDISSSVVVKQQQHFSQRLTATDSGAAGDDDDNKRISYISQGADSAKDALECGKF